MEAAKRPGASRLRKLYIARLIGRIAVFLAAVAVYFVHPGWLDTVEKGQFFAKFSPLHLLWGLWVIDMIDQLYPIHKHIALGSHKLFPHRFKPIRDKVNVQALKAYVTSTTKAAYKVLLIWVLGLAVIGVLYYKGFLTNKHLFLISVAFYVCDLICVLVWCPFRLMMRTRCCTTCRIFNWDHMMMFTPMMFAGSLYAISLLVMSLAVMAVWEICVFLYPERFWEQTNTALQCSECTDKLCTQYCQKLRR